MQPTDTIFATATAPGRSGVAVIRISGPAALAAPPHFGFSAAPAPRHAHFHRFACGGEPIDHGLILYFPAPHSFSGEDIVEFHLHGGMAILRRVLEDLAALPAFRLAEPGEFARRAFLNGKMDLTAAEGLADLIDAETEAQRRQAVRLMSGQAAQFYEGLRQRILEPLALLEAYIDFPEEDIPESVRREVNGRIGNLCRDIGRHLQQDRGGEKIRTGFSVVLLGAPNAGKSTLLNTLAQRDIAIVSHQAGTTRDLIEVHLDLHGLPVILVDTAGLRQSDEPVEMEGIRRAQERAGSADLKLVLIDATAEPDAESLTQIDNRTIILNTKCDKAAPQSILTDGFNPLANIDISSQSGLGIDVLISTLHRTLSDQVPDNQNAYIVRARHRLHLQNACDQLHRYGEETVLELQCERLRLAATELGVITGRIEVEDLLDVIFSRFCIGK